MPLPGGVDLSCGELREQKGKVRNRGARSATASPCEGLNVQGEWGDPILGEWCGVAGSSYEKG